MASVSINTENRKLKSGERVEYWDLRWSGPDGRRKAKCIGRTDEISKRKAHQIRLRQMAKLEIRPDLGPAPTLGAYLGHYLESREAELQPSTLILHGDTAKYLKAYFGDKRRMDKITRVEARAFKVALGKRELAKASKTHWRKMSAATVDKHIRNARTIFNHAIKDDLVGMNPFDRLTQTPQPQRDWHYVSPDEFKAMLDAADKEWRLLLGLCRLAALRRGEALAMRSDRIIDGRLQVIADTAWRPKDREPRWVPICSELRKLLGRNGHNGEGLLVENVPQSSIRSRFCTILEKAGVESYAKPFQSLRKSCIRDWAMRYPAHVVRAWSGHSSLDTMDRYYLQTPESEFQRASGSLFKK